MLNILNNEDITTLDRQIEQLMDYKPIPEHEVKQLCEKVLAIITMSALIFIRFNIGKGDSLKGIKCAASALSSNCMRRHPRSVP